MSFSWLLNVELSAANKKLNVHYLSYGDTSCNPSPISISNHSKQNDSHSRFCVLLFDFLSGATYGLWFWHPLWSPTNFRPCLLTAIDIVSSLGTKAASYGSEAFVHQSVSCYTFLFSWTASVFVLCVWFDLWSGYQLVKLSLEDLLLSLLHHGLINGFTT
jgi:hypothetical protein